MEVEPETGNSDTSVFPAVEVDNNVPQCVIVC